MRLVLEPLKWFCVNHNSTECECSPAWRLTCLASNLVVAAGLCHSYELGREPPPLGPHTYIAGGIVPAADWRPGHALRHSLTPAQGEK